MPSLCCLWLVYVHTSKTDSDFTFNAEALRTELRFFGLLKLKIKIETKVSISVSFQPRPSGYVKKTHLTCDYSHRLDMIDFFLYSYMGNLY